MLNPKIQPKKKRRFESEHRFINMTFHEIKNKQSSWAITSSRICFYPAHNILDQASNLYIKTCKADGLVVSVEWKTKRLIIH